MQSFFLAYLMKVIPEMCCDIYIFILYNLIFLK
jgi:hypothetical protein